MPLQKYRLYRTKTPWHERFVQRAGAARCLDAKIRFDALHIVFIVVDSLPQFVELVP